MDIETLRICSGCRSPLDHTQHKVVDINLKDLLQLITESGHGEPKLLEF